MATWEQILLGFFAVVIVVWFLPGIKGSLKNAPKAEGKDWMGLLIPVALVVLFVFFLIVIT